MKRKPPTTGDSVVPKEMLERARQEAASGRPRSGSKCVVCGSPVAPFSSEDLCWVCRRLKISAWREVDQQMPAQE